MLVELVADVRNQAVKAGLALRRLQRGKMTEVQALVIVGMSVKEINRALMEAEEGIYEQS